MVGRAQGPHGRTATAAQGDMRSSRGTENPCTLPEYCKGVTARSFTEAHRSAEPCMFSWAMQALMPLIQCSPYLLILGRLCGLLLQQLLEAVAGGFKLGQISHRSLQLAGFAGNLRETGGCYSQSDLYMQLGIRRWCLCLASTREVPRSN